MMLKAAIISAVLALAASQQAVQQYAQSPYYNGAGNLAFPQGQQYFGGYYNGQYQGPFAFNSFYPSNLFNKFQYISLFNNQNQPLGYIYGANSDAVLQQQQNFFPVKDFYGNLLGYYSLNQYNQGQEFQPQLLNEDALAQLQQFGFFYNQPAQGKFGFFFAKNPYVLYYNQNGVLRPSAFQNNYKFVPNFKQFPFNFFGQYYNGQYPSQYWYGQQYQGQYAPQYQGQYAPQYQGQYAPQYQGQYAPQYQGQYAPQYQGQYAPQYQGQYQGLYNTEYQTQFNNNQDVPAY